MAAGEAPRYRCHVGHAFISGTLLDQQAEKIEETLWVALRMFEERQNLLVTIGERQGSKVLSSILQRARDSQVHIDRLRAMLMAAQRNSSE